MKHIPALPDTTFENIVQPWLTGIQNIQDITLVISYPTSDRQRRTINLLSNRALRQKYIKDEKQYLYVTVDFRIDQVDGVKDLENIILEKIQQQVNISFSRKNSFEKNTQLLAKNKGKKVVLFTIGAEKAIQGNDPRIFLWFADVCRRDLMRMLVFIEDNIFTPENLKFLGTIPTFQPKIHFMKLYSEKDTAHFINHMQQQWNIAYIKPEIKKEIINKCGGSLLLVKEAIRYLRDHKDSQNADIFSHIEMKFNLAMLWNGLSDSDRQFMTALVNNQETDKNTADASIQYLSETGFIRKNKGTWSITVPLLVSYINNSLDKNQKLSFDDKNNILLDKTIISPNFSGKETGILKLLITKENLVTNREEIAATIWGDNPDKYSDWAIDSHISRLRKKLIKLYLPEDIIETKKRKGFILHN